MKTQKLKKSLLAPIVLVLMTVFSLSSCNPDGDNTLPAGPTIQLTEVGSGNNQKANIGGDLHLGAEIVAEGGIAKIEIEIHQEDGDYEVTKAWIEGKYIGLKNTDFHEHIDIPADAPAGDYHLHLIVTDANGRTATAEAELELLAKQPRPL